VAAMVQQHSAAVTPAVKVAVVPAPLSATYQPAAQQDLGGAPKVQRDNKDVRL
jgi:hypothetical protein